MQRPLPRDRCLENKLQGCRGWRLNRLEGKKRKRVAIVGGKGDAFWGELWVRFLGQHASGRKRGEEGLSRWQPSSKIFRGLQLCPREGLKMESCAIGGTKKGSAGGAGEAEAGKGKLPSRVTGFRVLGDEGLYGAFTGCLRRKACSRANDGGKGRNQRRQGDVQGREFLRWGGKKVLILYRLKDVGSRPQP